jgi:hypothetical protein
MAEQVKSEEIDSKQQSSSQRSEVVHDTVVLQLKLIVDGFRDLLLLPVCLVAGISGLVLHQKNPGRYLYRVLSYGRLSEKWIGLFDEAEKDIYEPLEYQDKKLNDILEKTRSTIDSKYINPNKKAQVIAKIDLVLDEINGKMKPSPDKPDDINKPQ